jgi:hypothetical protein
MNPLISAFNAGTIILFRVSDKSELSTKGAIKKTLGVKEGSYYSGRGNYWWVIERILKAQAVANGETLDESLRLTNVLACTHAFITTSKVSFNIMLSLKHGSSILGGYHFSKASMDELDAIVGSIYEARSIEFSFRSWVGYVEGSMACFPDQSSFEAEYGRLMLDELQPAVLTFRQRAREGAVGRLRAWAQEYTWIDESEFQDSLT